MGQMAKWKELPPSPEAIVRSALERAADVAHYAHDAYQGWGDAEQAIRALASDPAEVAAIIKKAGERHD
jgi:hypothetical protein